MGQYDKRNFQLGDYYLTRRGNSPAWCRTWFDPNTRQTKRASLGTTDFEQAKQILTDWFIANRSVENQPSTITPLAEVIARYWEQHAQYIASAERTNISLNYWLDFFEDRAVADLAPIGIQEEFHSWLLAKGMKASSVSRVLSAGRAAINRAWKRGEIENAPFIHDVKKAAQTSAPPRGRPLEVEEVAMLFDAAPRRHLRHYILFMLATAARPDAIRDLTIDRCDLENRLITLNPQNRQQTSKYRPTVRMPESIVKLVETLKKDNKACHVVAYGTRRVDSVKTSWRKARADAGLDDQVNPYSLRHTMARWLRKEGVAAWEVSAQLGHKRRELSITEIYAPYDPVYLASAAKAIDSFFTQLRVNSVLVDQYLKGDLGP